ncbi:hypothetical protein GZ77_24210 [Endozoicomonas montiporae]|uniref:5-carboxymethyl-2-hydroxymuconate isomerase n=2 Tax=Endozoicomonas montiporae TaxID=1027273 RepID=A0A081MZK8_9GAMM|nr:5-carboxymethyl-2-hydroxymuconate Delta-isomerase [Endozoicomonas montiporae]AMO54687.1 5-carboxymethyl-2-hydroxymuconate delta isomerase [Endozoicomonas montiporae CL-33]KEQ11631.1 hypothetical protein GZ77_24210 [Endozoicomonas montiporae]
MPHLIIDYSSNLEPHADFNELFESVQGYIEQSSLFPLTGLRCRAFASDHHHITSGDSQYAYVHVNFRIGAGRTVEQLKQSGEAINRLLLDWLEPVNTRGQIICALSFEITQIDSGLSWKHNPVRAHMARH